ncbi:MAG: crotonase/enoyl-CoA hydratase family protein [Polyangiaceae bacterium]|nr:crotonase/enoyl-CoA hydratase family protein [Polyangiaceae bacterium]MCW5791279.1 crotonase/enoyl-CoA hydratase family protein [Polyangiaceae bacterium]
MTQLVQLTKEEGGVGVVCLTRPEVRNAVDGPTAAALVRAFAELDADPEVRVVVLTGAGGHFCAGADLRAQGTPRGNRVEPGAGGPLGPTHERPKKPTVAAVEGYAVAGGLELALWCDLRVAAEDALFGVFCRRFGVPLIDGGTWRLPRLIGLSRALDLILTGRAVPAPEALTMGLVNRVVAPGTALEQALELARQLAVLPQACLLADRERAYAGFALSEAEALREELASGAHVLATEESRRAIARFAAGAGRHGQQVPLDREPDQTPD